MGKTTDSWWHSQRGLAAAASTRDGHAVSTGERISGGTVCNGDRGSGPSGRVADRIAAGHRHRYRAHQGQDRRDPSAPDRGGAGPRRDRARRAGFQAFDRLRRDHPWPRRIRTPRRSRWRPRSAARVRSTPTWRACTAPTRVVPDAIKLSEVMPPDARDGRLRARACCSCDRSSLPATTVWPYMYVQRSPIPREHHREDGRWNRGDHLRGDPHHRRGLRNAHRRARQAGYGGEHLQCGGRRQHQRRHHHPKRHYTRRCRRHLLVRPTNCGS